MAGGKETPRQKMIGMMYLVLLAMLAMNMSKQVLNAFVTINDKLVTSENALVAKTDGTYTLFDAKMALPENKKIVQPWLDRAHKVKDLANGLNNFLVSECSEMIEVVEKKPWHETGEDGVSHLLPLMAINGKDNYDAPTAMFAIIGSTEKRGQMLRTRIHKFRDSICHIMATYKEGKKNWTFTPGYDGSSMVEFDLEANITSTSELEEALKTCNPADTMSIANVYKSLSQPEKYLNHGEEYSWELTMFDHAPIVAASAMFTAFLVDIRNAESNTVEFLYGKVEVPTFNFNKIEPLAFAPTGYINQGDSIPLSVMIAAYDSTEVPIIKYGIDADTIPENWKTINGKIGIQGDKPGAHRAKGVIMVKQKGELVPKPWKFDYTVGAPMGVVALPEMRVLYRGYNNLVEGTASGFPADRVTLSGSGCKVSKKGKGYVATVGSGVRTAKISVNGRKEDGSSVNLGTFDFKVKALPTPGLYLGGISNGKTPGLSSVRAQTKVSCRYDESVPLTGVSFSIQSGTVTVEGIKKKGKISKGGSLDGNAKSILRQSKGKQVTIMVNYRGPDGVGKRTALVFTTR